MTMRRSVASLGLLLAAAGCSSPGELAQRHEPMAPPTMGHVTVAGTYGLFVAGDGEPLFDYPLKVGDRLGFESTATPVSNADELQVVWLYGVAGPHRGRLDGRQTYEWRRLADPR